MYNVVGRIGMFRENDRASAAIASSLIGRWGWYFPVFEEPRTARPDSDNEVIRRVNLFRLVEYGLAEGCKLMEIGLDASTCRVMNRYLSASQVEILGLEEFVSKYTGFQNRQGVIRFRKENAIPALFNALIGNKRLVLDERAQTISAVNQHRSRYLVVVENSEELGSIVGVNYACFLMAHLAIIDESSREEVDRITYSLRAFDEERPGSAKEDLAYEIRNDLLEKLKGIRVDRYEAVVFFTQGLPYGSIIKETATTHFSLYPDAGLFALRSIVADRAIRSALVVDPSTVEQEDTTFAVSQLTDNNVYTKLLKGEQATITEVDFHVAQLPYDLVLLTSHGGYARGAKLSVEFPDSEGGRHILVVRKADSFSWLTLSDKISVETFTEFESIDGVPWSQSDSPRPDTLSRVTPRLEDSVADGFAKIVDRQEGVELKYCNAIALSDGNYFLYSGTAWPEGPMVLANACSSFQRLPGDFVYRGANLYIGTTLPVLDAIASQFTQHLLKCGHTIAEAVYIFNHEMGPKLHFNMYATMGSPLRRIKFPTRQDNQYFRTEIKKCILRMKDFRTRNPLNPKMEEVDRRIKRLEIELHSTQRIGQ